MPVVARALKFVWMPSASSPLARAQETESTTDAATTDEAVPSNVMVSVSLDKKDYSAIVKAVYTMIRDFNITIRAGLATDTCNLSQMTTPGIASCRRATP